MFDEDEDQKLLAFAIGIVGVVVLMVVGFAITLAIANSEDGGSSDGAAVEVDGLLGEVNAALAEAGVEGVSVSIDGGVVTLTGEVADQAASDAAEEAAAGVEGVESVVNELTIAGDGEGSDEDLLATVRAAIGELDGVDAGAIDVSVEDGVVTLAGEVADEDASARAEAAALAVDGVASVDNQLTIAGAGDLSDDELQANVEDAIGGLSGLSSDGIVVSVDGGVVTLTGEVADEDQRDLAVAEAESVDGVVEVVDQLTIAADEAEAAGAALEAAVDGGTVTLTGAVADEATRTALVEDTTAALGDEYTIVDELEVDENVVAGGGELAVTGAFDAEDEQAVVVAGINEAAVAAGLTVDDQTSLVEGADTLEALNDLFADGGVQFESSQATLTDASIAVLDQAVELLTDAPDLIVAITGYTDSSGNAEANQQLSEDRAQTVADYLIDNGVDADQIGEVVGRGSENPVASNDTPEGRAQNRRIEFGTSRA